MLSGVWGQFTYTWNGGAGTPNWNDATNWTPVGVPGAADTANFFVNGFEAPPTVTVNIAGAVTVANLNSPNPNYQDDPYTLTFTGAGSLTVTGVMEFYRPTSDLGADEATYVFDIDTVCNGTIITHTGTTVSIPAGRTMTANVIEQQAGNHIHPTNLNVAGTLEANTIRLATSAVVGMALNVATTGEVRVGTLERTAYASAVESNNEGLVIAASVSPNVVWTAGSNEVVIAAPASTFVWIGGAGPASAADITNWSPTGTPGAGDTAVIQSNSQIQIPGAATIGRVFVQSGYTAELILQAGTLTVATGLENNGNLTISGAGDLAVSGTTENDGTLTTAAGGTRALGALTNEGTLAVGTSTVSATSIAGSGAVTLSTGTISAAGTIASLTTTGAATVNMEGNVTALTVSAGAPTLNGTGAGLAVGGNPGGAITTTGTVELDGTSFTSITNSGDLTISNPASLSGNLIVTGGTVTTVSSLSVGGNTTLDAGTGLTLGGNLTVTGNWTDSGATFTPGTNTVFFTPSGTSTITGTTSFYNLSCLNQGGDVLSIANAITVSNDLTLTGTNAESLLTVTGAGSISLSSHQVSGNFLTVYPDIDIIGPGAYTTYSSTASGDIPSGWYIAARTAGNYVWTGLTSTDWHTGSNWDAGFAPTAGTDNVEIVTAASLPTLSAPVGINNLTVTSGTLTLAAGLTVASLINQSVIEITSTGSINTSDNGSGTFRYSTGGGTILPLAGYNNLEITDATWTANTGLTVNGMLTVSDAASANFNADPAGQATSADTVDFTTSGTISFGNAGADSFTVITGALALSGAPTFTLAGTLSAGGGITLGKDVSLSAGTTFASASILTAPVTVTNGTNTLTLSQSLDCSGYNLTLSDSGQLVNNSTLAVGGAALSTVAIGGTGTVSISNGGSIDAAGTIATLTVSATTDTITLDGNGGLTITNPVQGNLITDGTVTLNSTALLPITSLANSGTITLNGDLHVTGDISTSGSLTVPNTRTLVQGAGASFTVSAGTVSIGTNTCTIGNLTVTAGSFTQTGLNAGPQSATSLTTSEAGTITWDSVPNGGTLTLAGDVNAAGGSISFGQKNVTFTANATISDGTYYAVTVAGGATVTGQGVFFDLIVLGGGTFTEDGDVRVQRNLTINDGGSYTEDPTYTLTFGGAGSVAGGTITDSNTGAKQSLGDVIIDAGGQTKNAAGGGILMTSMDITAGTFAAEANTIAITGNLSGAGTFTGGAAAIDIDGDVTVTTFTAASGVNTTTVGGDFTPGAFGANGGTMVFDGTAGSTIAAGTFTYNNVEINANKNAAPGTFTITGTLNLDGTGALDLASNNTALDVTGITTNQGVITGGLANLLFRNNYNGGTGSLTGAGPDFTTQFLLDATFGNFTHNSGEVLFSGGNAQSVTMPTAGNFNTLTINKSDNTWSTATTAAASTANLSLQGAGTITFTGDFDVTGSFSNPGSTASILFTGDGSRIDPAATFLTTGTVTIGNDSADTLTFAGGFTHEAGSTVLAGTLRTENTLARVQNLQLGANATIDTGAGPGNIEIEGNVTIAVASTLQLAAGTGNIEVTGTAGTLTSFTVTSANNAIFRNNITTNGAGGLAITATNIRLDGLTINTNTGNGTVTFNGPVQIDDTLIITRGTGLVQFNSPVTSEAGESNPLTIDGTGGGQIAFNDTVGSGPGQALGAMIISTTTGITATSSINAASFTQSAGTGTTSLQELTVTGAVNIAVTTADILLNDQVTAPAGFSSTGTVAGSDFTNSGTITTTDTDITINHTGVTTIGAALESGTGDIAIGNTTNGTIELSVAAPAYVAQTVGGNITFNRPVTLTQNTLISTGAGIGTVTFATTAPITGNFALGITAGTGNVEIVPTAGTPLALTSLTVSSATLATFRDNITTEGPGGITITATTINLDGLTMTAGTDPAASINLNGNVTLSSGLTSLYAVNEINVSGTVTGTVSGAQNLTVQTSTAATSAILFNGDVGTTATLLGAITIINGYDITFGGSVNAASITQTAGANSTTFTGNVNTTGAITITAATNVTFSGTVDALSLAQTNGSGTTTFQDDVNITGAAGIDVTATNIALDGLTMEAGTAPTAAIALTGAVTLSTAVVDIIAEDTITVTGTVDGGVPFSATSTNDANIVFTSLIGGTTPLASLSITGGDITLNGIGTAGTAGVTGAISVTSAGNVVLNGTSYRSGNTITVTATGFVELNAADYRSDGEQTWEAPGGVRYLATVDGTWSAGGAGISCPNTDVYLDHNGRTLTLGSNLSCLNLYFYRGNLDCNNRTITTTTNLVIFGGDYNPDDADWDGADTRHAYFGAAALAYYPGDGTYDNATGAFSTAPNAAFTNLAGTTLTVDGNFYVNGTDMNAGAFTLVIPDNDASTPVLNTGNTVTADQWGTPYAVAFNMLVTGVTTYDGWVAASRANGDETNNGVNILSTTAGGTGGWQFARPEIRLAQTIYDDVIYIELDMPAENSNGEIAATLAMPAVDINAGALWTGTGTLKIGGVYSQPDCSAPLTGDASSFYVRTDSAADPRTWNTDAIGTNAGHLDSTDRDGNNQTIIPDLTGLKGLFRAANGKTMSRHYGTQNSTDFPSYTATEDRCRPVLVEARFGQELHDNDPATQRPYDAHNFIEFRWSEQVDIGDPVNGFAGGTEETVYGIKYKKASATFNDTTAFGGAITGSGPLTVSGYATFQAGRVQTGSRGTYVSPVPAANDPTVHALYREFSLTAGGTPADQPHRLRISIAGWSEETRVAYGTDWKWFWQGYIDDAQSPSGLVTVPATEFIRDRSPARNSIEGTNSIAAGYGASNYDKDPVEVTTTATGLYGTWDTTAPDFAGLKASSDDWATEPAEYELIPVSSAAGLVSRLEMHFFDNEVQYTAADNWRWLSRTGWYQTDPATIIHPAPESFGGSRPYPVAANTTGGGVRDASFTGASSAFRIRNNAEVITGAELPGFLTGVNAVFYNLTTSHVVADDPYMTVRIDDGVVSWPIANAQLELSYTAYDTGNPSGGFVTDLAGNRLGSTDYIRALDRTPPRITLSLAGANRSELYLVFSKNLSTGLDAEDGIRLELHAPAGGLVTLTPTAVTSGPMSNRALLFTLPDAITADQLVHPDSAIRFVNYGTAPNQETGILEPVSAYSDNMGNYVSLAETHRVTDIAIDFLEVLYASDGVNTDGVFGEDEGALRVFDGSGRLLERNITVGTRLVSETSAPLALTMYFDAAPATNTLPDLFEDATGIALPFWLPTILPGFNSRGNTAARRTGTDQILDANRLLRNFVIPEADEEMNPGSRIEMLFRYGDLYCARLSDPEDITSLAPWSFSISETKRQRGGVTILNNVIDSNRREQTIIQVEVAKAGNIVVQVFTLDGNLVRVLERGRKGAGTYSYYWDGTNLGGRPVARGMYFVRVVGPDIDEIRKVMVVKE